MTRRFETGRRRPLPPSLPQTLTESRGLGRLRLGAALSARARLSAAVIFSAAGLLALAGQSLACQNEAAPPVRSEPQAAPAATSPSRQPSSPASAAAPAAGAEAAAATLAASPSPTPAANGSVGLAKYEPATAKGSAQTAPAPGRVAEPSADGPAKPAAGQPVQGAAVSEEPFSIWLQSVSPIAAGSAATVEAVLVAKPPYHCNADYPHKFKLAAAPTTVAYPETTVKGAKVTAERSVLSIPVQAQSPGKAKVSGTLSFSVCNDERCLVEKRDLSLDLEVK